MDIYHAAAAKSLQSCPTLCDPRESSPPGSPVPGILQARTLEWVAISFSSAWKWKGKVKSLSCVRLFATPWTAAYPAPPSMGFSRQKYWSRIYTILATKTEKFKKHLLIHLKIIIINPLHVNINNMLSRKITVFPPNKFERVALFLYLCKHLWYTL